MANAMYLYRYGCFLSTYLKNIYVLCDLNKHYHLFIVGWETDQGCEDACSVSAVKALSVLPTWYSFNRLPYNFSQISTIWDIDKHNKTKSG